MKPTLNKSIPTQVINEQAAYGPFKLTDFIQTKDGSVLRFSASLKNGNALPKGMILTEDGILTGIPAKGTQGNYEVVVNAASDGDELKTEFLLTIKPSLSMPTSDYIDKLKSQVWEALHQNLPIPDLTEIYTREITPAEIYYLLERWGIITAWNVFNLDPPGPKVPLKLEGISPHYNVFDRGSCIVGAPKDLYSHERTVLDGMQTAKAIAQEVYKRGWTVELAGFDKLTRAAWVEIQHLGDIHGKPLEVINFQPRVEDLKIYNTESLHKAMRGLE